MCVRSKIDLRHFSEGGDSTIGFLILLLHIYEAARQLTSFLLLTVKSYDLLGYACNTCFYNCYVNNLHGKEIEQALVHRFQMN